MSPFYNVLCLGDKLVLQVQASGGYDHIQWRRISSSESVNLTMENLVHFGDIYFIDHITIEDFGVYSVQLLRTDNRFISPSNILHFVVLQQGNSNKTLRIATMQFSIGTNTTILAERSILVVDSGHSVNISCTSIGDPIPNIIWTLNNQTTRFNQSLFPSNLELLSNQPIFYQTQSSIQSVLHIVNASHYDRGVYECTGSNENNGFRYSSSDAITIQIMGMIVAVA